MRRNMRFTVQVERRICHLQSTVKVDTQELRKKWIIELDDLFSFATSIAKGNVIQQQIGDKMQSITPKERQMWAQIAAKVGMVMANMSRGFDEREFDENLQELDKLVDEIKNLTIEPLQEQDLHGKPMGDP